MRLIIILLIFVNTMFAFDIYTQALDQNNTTNPLIKQETYPPIEDNIAVVSLIASAPISGSVWIEDGATSCTGTKLAETTVNTSAVDSTTLSNANSDGTITDTEFESMVVNVFLISEVAKTDLTDSSTFTVCLSHDGSGAVAATLGGITALDPGYGSLEGGEIPIDADDINGDGIADIDQNIIVETVLTSIGTIGVSNALGTVSLCEQVPASAGTLDGVPAELSSPYGLLKVNIDGAVNDVGDTATITLNLPSSNANECYKLNNNTSAYDKIDCIITTSNGRTFITYDVKDGGDYDGGGEDKNIIDPLFTPYNAPSRGGSINAPISPKTYMFLALAILGIGMYQYRRRVV